MREVTVVYHEENGLWWAESEQVPGWVAGGGSFTQARRHAREGLPFLLGACAALDERVPWRVRVLGVAGHPGVTVSAGVDAAGVV